MKIDILGIAQDGGCPHAGCLCDNCINVYKGVETEKFPACLGITVNDFRVLVEATPKLDTQLHKWRNLNNATNFLPNATIITHAHIGHYAGLIYLGKEVLNVKGHKVYCSEKMANFLTDNSPFSDLVINGNIVLKTLPISEEIYLNNHLKVEAVEVPHRNEHADTLGLIISSNDKSIFFLPDIDSWEGFLPKLNEILKRVDIAFLDATFYDHSELGDIRGRDLTQVPHPTVIQTLDLIKNNKISTESCDIYLTHFNHTNRLIHSKKECLTNGVFLAKQSI